MCKTGGNMELREYLFRHMIRQKDFAKKINFSPNHLRSIIYKIRKASPKMAEAIERETGGIVTKEEV